MARLVFDKAVKGTRYVYLRNGVKLKRISCDKIKEGDAFRCIEVDGRDLFEGQADCVAKCDVINFPGTTLFFVIVKD